MVARFARDEMFATSQVNPPWRAKPAVVAIRAVTFDVYSALFDTVRGLTAALSALALGRGSTTHDPGPRARTWRQQHFQALLLANSLDREPASNRRALENSARAALRDLNPPPQPRELEALIDAWERLPPWPEVMEVLVAVRARPFILATLSNGDEEMLQVLLRTLPIRFDHLISTQGGRFKPHPSIYEKALRVLRVPAEELLHVAGSANDAMGATAYGIRTIWVNRTGEAVLDPRYAPAFESPDLRGVLPILQSLS